MANKAVIMILAFAALPCLAQSNLLQITSPASGTVVHPGQVVVISVSADPSVSHVAIMGEDPLGFSQTTNGQPLHFQLTIPSNTTIGSYNVTAMGSADRSLVASAPISLQVDYCEVAVPDTNGAVGAAVLSPRGNCALTRNWDLREWLPSGHDPLESDELFVPKFADRNRR